MPYVTGLHEEEKVVYYIQTRGAYDVRAADERLTEKGCINVQLWAVDPSFENEIFAEMYAAKSTEIRPL